MTEIPKAYNPSDSEDKWFRYWTENNLYHSEPDKNKQPYTIVIPPPNITGMLTVGHVLNNTLQDIFIRTKRMQGYNACWVPGIDHASIATENKVTSFLKEKGIEKEEIGREEFLKYCWEWKDKYGGIIIQQLKKLGVSCDWERERFTMDEHYYRRVIETFVDLYNEGKIYKGFRMVNWDPASRSAISDEEVIFKEVNGKLWYIKYPVKGTEKFIVVATTRPETMLGDTGVAVNPEDERYKELVGKTVLLPLTGREIPVFTDSYVDKEFGTGAVKVTPGHDFNDYEMGIRHDLEIINILNDAASTNDNVPEEFRNMDRFVARKKVVEALSSQGFLEKTEDYQNKVGYSDRGGVPIEPYISEQWFMKMDEVAGPAFEVVRNGRVNFHPSHWIKTYEHWMSNITDWCISRQLWWGHRIPVWYCRNSETEECKNYIVQVEKPETCPHCGSDNIEQDKDVLDTWASSWLWAYDVFEKEDDQRYYYPTSTLVTGPDIIFFWVARMIMAGMHFKKDIPFRDVYFTSIVRDTEGFKMSKSRGNSPDPLELISNYGADALRFTMIYLAPMGQDVFFSSEKCETGRNFANKIWNAGRFLLMNAGNIKVDKSLIKEHIDFADRWILSRLNRTLKELNDAMEKFEVNIASKIIYTFVWNDFCDWYIEMIKNRIYSDDEEVKTAVLSRAVDVFEKLLKMVHPFMPFITEELWHAIEKRGEKESISVSDYPESDPSRIDTAAEEEMTFVQDIITALRNIRGEMNIAPSKTIKVFIKSSKVKEHQVDYIKKLARAEEVTTGPDLQKPKASASSVIKGTEIYVPLGDLIDLSLEKSRIQKEISRIENSLQNIEKKLSNEKFINNAALEVVEKERAKKRDWESNLHKLKKILPGLEQET
jgi:valyl-tRNA synthetase